MDAINFTTELGPEPIIKVPEEIAAQLPKSGKARVIILTDDDDSEAEWILGSYEQFVQEDTVENADYDEF